MLRGCSVNKRTIPICSGGCESGRRACPTPQACQIPESEALEYLRWLLYGVCVLLAVACALHLIAAA